MNQLVVTKIENGYVVQPVTQIGYGHQPAPVTYCKDLDAVFALLERLFEEAGRRKSAPGSLP